MNFASGGWTKRQPNIKPRLLIIHLPSVFHHNNLSYFQAGIKCKNAQIVDFLDQEGIWKTFWKKNFLVQQNDDFIC
jgi:hypothetical protein